MIGDHLRAVPHLSSDDTGLPTRCDEAVGGERVTEGILAPFDASGLRLLRFLGQLVRETEYHGIHQQTIICQNTSEVRENVQA